MAPPLAAPPLFDRDRKGGLGELDLEQLARHDRGPALDPHQSMLWNSQHEWT
jgi:hypothetical protein